MKKLIAVATLLLAFTITANAQNKTTATVVSANATESSSNEARAKKDVAALIAKVTINEDFKKDMYTLMVMKYDELAKATTSAEKEKISKAFERKIVAGLNPAQREQLNADPELLKKLSH